MTNPSGKNPRFSLSSSGSGSKRGYHHHMTPELIEASFSHYNGWEKRSLELETGGQVRLVLERQLTAGAVRCEVSAPDGNVILRFTGTSVDEGVITATIGGKYPIRITAENAVGSYRLALHNS